ncbi:hypothetical protein SERLADRAFT_389543 [Serpula lacrymans var. lacrymans S7.9]|uniref:Uncharacterized protein n=1 Tax=Serpula lacrymans var. lacrymans (strain S7.9) TaxID=578457 RepID=F8NWP8_SERL9|nr:uncharacterized protein SERLADRAFT_389543 [Serpula lacrymans var. lacrymans S7.9]EGO24400.1 hypothetical protein SERLADRAFT_389543 [Serpula lacrymans var. lacrymans S7.9]
MDTSNCQYRQVQRKTRLLIISPPRLRPYTQDHAANEGLYLSVLPTSFLVHAC